MNRRDFIATGASGALGSAITPSGRPGHAAATGTSIDATESRGGQSPEPRALFPRLEHEVFLNAAAGTPLGTFAQDGLRAYEEYWSLGPGEGRRAYFNTMLGETRDKIARLIGAADNEIAFVQCTKHGEQIVMDGIPALRAGGNLVTNDLHFSGSLHHLVGMRRAGMDVRIVRSEDWQTTVAAMAEAIDDDTALVSVTLVSNVNGHIEPVRELADVAHSHGAYVYADIIQATGIFPVDVTEMGIDFAAGNGYKWLFGPFGTGFLYVRHELQGSALEDRLFPGNARHNYEPWVAEADPEAGDFVFRSRMDGQRYQPGHQAYLCYAALHEGLKFVEDAGVDRLLSHTVGLNQRLYNGLDADRYTCISPHVDRSPIITFRPRGDVDVERTLGAANVVVSLVAGSRIRVSPAVFNDESDIDALIEALNRA